MSKCQNHFRSAILHEPERTNPTHPLVYSAVSLHYSSFFYSFSFLFSSSFPFHSSLSLSLLLTLIPSLLPPSSNTPFSFFPLPYASYSLPLALSSILPSPSSSSPSSSTFFISLFFSFLLLYILLPPPPLYPSPSSSSSLPFSFHLLLSSTSTGAHLSLGRCGSCCENPEESIRSEAIGFVSLSVGVGDCRGGAEALSPRLLLRLASSLLLLFCL